MKTSRKIVVTAASFCLLVALIIAVFVFKLVNWHIAKNDFYHAIENNDIDNVRILLEEYPSLANSTRDPVLGFMLHFFMDYREANALTCALHSHADVELIKLLVENGADVNKHPLGNSEDYPLLLALGLGEYEAARYFIEQGADIHISTKLENASHALLRSRNDTQEKMGTQFELFQYMIAHEVSLEPPSGRSDEKETYLCKAVISGNVSIVEFLLTSTEFQADLNVVDEYGSTPLMYAVQKQYYDVCQLLLEHGADVTIQRKNGKTAYDYAVELEDSILIQMPAK